MADGLAIFGTGIGVSGSQVGLNALTATLYPTQSRATGVSWSNAVGPLRRHRWLALRRHDVAMNLSFSTLFYVIAVPAAVSAGMLILLTWRSATLDRYPTRALYRHRE
ncbi:hypothetical protein [Klebsiella pneumoniae]|uniref:hypothetical protein n=1 Tax=Klebsiella pneumoniae TaxID=573 RepID=UPI002041906B|nr:hypothetical protein [Klebsiella pneumoniae]